MKTILGDALTLPIAEQQAFIERQASDPEELAELRALCMAGRQDDPLLDTRFLTRMKQEALNHLDALDDAPWVGREVGGYRLEALIARGGMGQVYEARRVGAPAGPQVAVKLMRDGLMDGLLAQRFLAERQTLAALDHPHLARLLDGGISDGIPYLVMERVVGEPIDVYCHRHALPLADKLRLFETLCEVVQHAHERGVVHRDLKPANVLVTSDGIVKLVDFGIAKRLKDPTQQTRTATSLRLMTLAFASPEQVRGDPITPASDVYSLGVLLYGLLTNKSPYRAGNDLELRNAICRTPPVPPSQRLSGAPRDHLRGNLDAVVLAALRKDPRRRYASAQALAEDIRRHLEGRLVEARWGRWLRAGRWLGRHRVLGGVLAASLVSLLNLGAVAWALRDSGQQAAQQQQAESLDWIDAALDVQDELQTVPAAVAARRRLVQQCLDQLRRLPPPSPEDPPARVLRQALAHRRLAQAQDGGQAVAPRGDPGTALHSLASARALLDLLEGWPGTNEEVRRAARRERAAGSVAMARLFKQEGRMDEAQAWARRGLAEAQQAADAGPAAGRRGLAEAQLNLAQVLEPAKAGPDVRAALASAKTLLEALHAEAPADLDVTESLGAVHVRQAQYLLQADVDLPRSAPHAADEFRRGIALLTPLLSEHPQARQRLTLRMAHAQSQLGAALLKAQQTREAVASGTQARDTLRLLTSQAPDDPALQRHFAEVSSRLSQLLLTAGAADAAVQAGQDATTAFAAAGAATPETRGEQLQHGLAHRILGQALIARAAHRSAPREDGMPADWRSACESYRQSLQRLGPLQPRWHADPLVPDTATLIEMRQVLQTCPAP